MTSHSRRTNASYTSIHPSLDVLDNFRDLAVNLPVSEDTDDRASTTPSNPDQWRERRSKKMHDLQLHYSCDPLRVVSDPCSVRADNLHATLSTVLPQPKGVVKEIRQKVPHVSDDAIVRQASKLINGDSADNLNPFNSAPPAVKDGRGSATTTPSSVAEASRKVLESQNGMRRSAPLKKNGGASQAESHPAGVLRPPPAGGKPSLAQDDGCSSVFSVTTTGMRTSIPGKRPGVESAGSAGASSSHGVTAPATARLADLVAAKQDALPSVSSAGSVVSKASSSKRVEHVEQQILEERRANSTISTHIREATLQLDRLEKLLSRREKPFTHN